MRHVIEAGTDAASLVLFDPAALPEDFEARFLADAPGALEELDRYDEAVWIQTDGDGGYLLHAYVNEPIPRELEADAFDPRTIQEFPIPSGRLVFAGSEGIYREDDDFLRRYPHMGGQVRIPPGAYTLRLLRTHFADGAVDDRFHREASPWEYRLWSSMRLLIPVSVAAWIGLVVIFFTRVRVPFPRFLAPILIVVFTAPFVVRRLEPFRRAKQRFVRIERECPSHVAQLYLVRQAD